MRKYSARTIHDVLGAVRITLTVKDKPLVDGSAYTLAMVKLFGEVTPPLDIFDFKLDVTLDTGIYLGKPKGSTY